MFDCGWYCTLRSKLLDRLEASLRIGLRRLFEELERDEEPYFWLSALMRSVLVLVSLGWLIPEVVPRRPAFGF